MTNEQAFAAPLTILAVDDDADALRATERILREAGFRVVTGATAAEALELTHHHHPALVLLDVMLPDGSGVDVARQLKGDPALADVFVILFSGTKVSPDDQAKGLAEGLADGYMVRPLGKPELLARIEAFLRIRETQRALRESEARLTDIVEAMTDWVWETDEAGVYTYSSQQSVDFFGRSRGYVIGKSPFDFMPPDEAARVAVLFADIVANKAPIVDLENWNLDADGERFCLLTNGVPMLDDAGNLMGYRGVDRDITARKQTEDALRESEERFKAIAEYAASWEAWFSPQGRLLWMNQYSVDLTGFTPEEYMAAEDYLSMVIAEEDLAMVAEQFQGALQGSSGDGMEIRIPRKDGSLFWASVSWRPILDANGLSLGFRTSTQDITARKRADEALALLNDELTAETAVLAEANATIMRVAATDDLTGLANRRHFYESLAKAVSLARRHGSPLALVSLDLDGLKRVNDDAGHEAGDEVLTRFAALLAALCRAEDLPARLGGDEFCVLLPGIDQSGALGLAERVLAAVRSSPGLAKLGVTVSGGVAQWTPGEFPDDLLRRADQVLYAAKRGGGDAVVSGG